MGSAVRDQSTFTLVFSVLVFLRGAVLFGVESDGTYTLPATHKALMNSLPWIGKTCSCFGTERAIEGLGFKKTMYLAALIQIVAVISTFRSSHMSRF